MKVDATCVEDIRRRLIAYGGHEANAGADQIEEFLRTRNTISEHEAIRLLHSVWGWVSMAMDRSSGGEDREPDMNDLEAQLAAVVTAYRDRGNVV